MADRRKKGGVWLVVIKVFRPSTNRTPPFCPAVSPVFSVKFDQIRCRYDRSALKLQVKQGEGLERDGSPSPSDIFFLLDFFF